MTAVFLVNRGCASGRLRRFYGGRLRGRMEALF